MDHQHNTEKPSEESRCVNDLYDEKIGEYDKLPVGKKGSWVLVQKQCNILKERRMTLGLTQEQVAEKARIHINQYQKFESGERDLYSASFRIGVSICIVLRIDPSTFVALPGYPMANPDAWIL